MKQQRSTKQRRVILDAVRARHDHPNAEQIYQDVHTINEHISRGTVYRNLNLLAQNGEITQVRMPDCDRFDERIDRHYHLLCLHCGKLTDAPMEYREADDDMLYRETGYLIACHRVTFEGICPECQKLPQIEEE